MSNNPVTSINAKKRGTTRFLTGSTPSTCTASSSSRILRAPRSAVIAVPATPANTIASTNGANSRIEANTKNPPNRSNAPNNTKKFAACNPGAPYPNATVDTNNGNQHNRNANKNCDTNPPPYGYGGRNADTTVFPVKIIMSPTSSSRFFVGRNARSATLRTKVFLSRPQGELVPSGHNLWQRVVGCQPGTEPQRNVHLPGSFRAAVRRRTITGLCAVAVVAAGCGGGTRQDADEPSGTFKVDVVSASFPSKQRLARQEQMVVEVRNADNRTIPNVAVTVDPGFSVRSERTDLADPNRPVWIIDDGPKGGTTAYTNTWAVGALKPGDTAKFVWKVTAVRSGTHEVHYRIAAGLNGKAKAAAAGGDPPEGSFTVNISGKPAQANVDPPTR